MFNYWARWYPFSDWGYICRVLLNSDSSFLRGALKNPASAEFHSVVGDNSYDITRSFRSLAATPCAIIKDG